MTNRNFKGVWIPREIWLNADLSLQEKVFLIEIDSLQDDVRGCFAGNKHFAEFFQMSESRASQVISGLQRKGLIIVKNIRKGPLTVERQIHISAAFNILKTGGNAPLESCDAAFRILRSPPLESCEHINTTDIINTGLEENKEDARENALDDIFGMSFSADMDEPESEQGAIGEVDDFADNGSEPEKPNLPAVIVGEVLPPKKSRKPKAALGDEADAFYAKYPKKVDRPLMEKAMRSALLVGTFAQIMESLQKWCILWELEETEERHIPAPSVWLNKQRWTAEIDRRIENAKRNRENRYRAANASDRYVPMVQGAILAATRFQNSHQS